MKKIKAILFDLDGTLIPEEEANDEAFLKISKQAANKYNIDSKKLAVLARNHARKLFYNHPSYSFCEKLGVGSGEALCADFFGDEPELVKLRHFASEFKINTWFNALSEIAY